MFVTCGPNQKIEYDTEETYRSCPGFPNAGHTGYIGRCVPDVSCQAGNGAPATPTITGPTSGVVNAVPPYTFTVSAEDPERNNLRYGISDASCSTVYEWLPGNGVVPSNTAQSFDRTFTADGSYTFYVLAEDEAFARSSCAEHTIIISPAPAPAADLKLDGSDGPLDVGKNTQHTLTWTSANAASCTLFGEGMGNLGTTVTATGTMSVTISQSNSFTMSCSGAPDEVVVNVVNQAPEAPAVSHPTGNAPFDTLTTFNIQGNDPDGDDVFYEVDWDLTDNIDFNTITSGGVNNSIQMASRAFAASGPQRIRARTVDVPVGLRSGWTEYTITIDTAPAPIATLEAAVNGGSFSSDDQTVNPGDTVTMLWDSQNASSCSGSGSGFDTGSARSGADAVNTPAANSQTTFTARCDGPGGSGSESLIITTRQLPNLSRPNITSQLSSSFDLATGYYDYVDITFNTQNTGGSDTRASADYEFKFDNGRDGYEYSRNGSLGLFTVLQTVGRTERVAGPIEFGNSLAYVAADIPLSSDGVVEETDEDDNDREVLITFLPPDPGLSITAERTQLREGEATRINWSRRASYPLDCTVTGPNVLVDNAPREGQRPTAAIMAKSVFTYTCIEPITGTQFSDSVSVETTGSIEET